MNNKIVYTTTVFACLMLWVGIFYSISLFIKDTKQAVDCTIAEFSLDYSAEIKQLCRQARSKK